jgi:ABC-2 type transport system permease protein
MSDLATSTPVGQALTMAGRCLRVSRRQVDALIMSLLLPVLLMVMFVELFGGAIDTGTKYVTYVVPGVILLCAGFGSATTAVSVSQDMTGGLMDRLRSMNVSGKAVLAGHVTASVARTAVSIELVFLVAAVLGFEPSAGPLDWLAVAGVLLAFVIAVSSLAVAIGLLAKSPEAANGFTFFVTFLPYASSGFVPVRTMPSWIQGFAQRQPITPITETLRGLLLGTGVGSNPWQALAWCGAVTATSVAVSSVLFQRRIARS